MIELGVYTFAERTPDPATGRTIGAGERLRRLMEEISLADELGLDVFASASTTGPSTRSRRRPWCWARRRRAPRGSS